MFSQFDTFGLRPLVPSDAPALTRHLSNPNVLRNLSRPPDPFTLKDAEAFIASGPAEDKGEGAAIVVEDALVGCIGYRMGQFTSCRQATVGYWLAEPFWGRGIMTRAVSHVSEYLLAKPEVIRVEAVVFSWNPASARVLEKAGFEYEGRMKQAVWKNGQVCDLLLYARV